MATAIIPGVQYSGIWTMQQVNSAISAGTWPAPAPHLYSWGQNTGGQLGLGNTTNYSSPKQVRPVFRRELRNVCWRVLREFQ